MEYRSFGRTGVQVSPLCLGCMNFGGWSSATDEESTRIIHAALDAGINFLDTADVYSKGGSETVVGKALAGGKRDNIFLATKVNARMSDEPNDFGNHRRHIISSCDASLRRLQTDWIDLYQIHRPQPDVPIDETLRALDDLIRGGKVRYIGTSTFGAWQLAESVWVAKELGLNRFVSEQPPYNLLDRRVERELLPCCITYGMAVIPWSPLAGGLLTGKYLGDAKPSGSRFEKQPPVNGLTPQAPEVIEKFVTYARERGTQPSQLALAWVAAQQGITAPIIGPRTLDQLHDHLGALEVKLTDGDRKAMDDIIRPEGNVAAYYEAKFGPHPHRLL
jgi:aryl-alcohol dehydrogenase-like predicted oxidoreductase